MASTDHTQGGGVDDQDMKISVCTTVASTQDPTRLSQDLNRLYLDLMASTLNRTLPRLQLKLDDEVDLDMEYNISFDVSLDSDSD